MDAHIKTDRLNLRFVTEADVDAIQQCIVDPRIYEMVGRIPANQPRTATVDWISTHKAGRDAKTDFVYAIILKTELIGLVGIHRPKPSDLFEIGFWMSPNAWGKGYVTEASKAVLQSLENSMGPQKTVSGYFKDNPASGRVLEKLGYVQIDENEMHCAGRNKTLPHIIVERDACS